MAADAPDPLTAVADGPGSAVACTTSSDPLTADGTRSSGLPPPGADPGARPAPVDGPGAPGGPDHGLGNRPPDALGPAPAPLSLPDTSAAHGAPQPLLSHGCWYPSAAPDGRQAAFICDRAGVPQLWAGPLSGEDVRLLDADPQPVTEVSWSPDGRWIAYTVAPGGGELTQVLCVRPDGTDRRLLAGGEPGASAHLGCWQHDGTALAVTVTEPAPPGRPHPGHPGLPAQQGPQNRGAAADHGLEDRTLSAYLVDPDGLSAPVLLAAEPAAPTLRVCDLSQDGRLALLRRGPRGRREALVVRTGDLAVTCVKRVADGDPWIGAFSPDGRTVWLRSDDEREYAALTAIRLDPRGQPLGATVVAERDGCGLELLYLDRESRNAALAWNAKGVSELELTSLPPAAPPDGTVLPLRPVHLPHEVVTRVAPLTGDDGPVVALSGSRRRPGIWHVPSGAPVRTPWSSRDEDAVPPGRPPTRPVPMRPVARDGLTLGGWYYRAPGRSPGEPAPCVLHLHGGPEEQERPVLHPLYHELISRGLDVFAPDVRGSSGHGRSFVDADLGEGRFAAIDDVADCAAHAVAEGLADPRRLAVMGRSYGGYLVMASLVWHPHLFRTGIAVCGMSDLMTFFAGTEPWIARSAAHKYGHPEHDRDLLRSLSPMSRIDELRAPVLAVHGEHDTNVPPAESEQFVRAARERGLEARLLLLREEGHDFRRADNRRLFRRTAADWMQRHLTG
ncbi:S9 family peptidase [Streptomyces sp. NPDC088254]|uniref:S9 family peptidase n=1 Tax=Streptomyces sp. NPDC088254 TaxID=3365847 RepID=UPI0038193083